MKQGKTKVMVTFKSPHAFWQRPGPPAKVNRYLFGLQMLAQLKAQGARMFPPAEIEAACRRMQQWQWQ